MPEQLLSAYVEKGFLGAVGFILTSFMGLFMFNLRRNKEFRAAVHKKIDLNARRVTDNHPTKDEFTLAFNALERQMSSIHEDVREIRERL